MREQFNKYMDEKAPIQLKELFYNLNNSDGIMLQCCFEDFAAQQQVSVEPVVKVNFADVEDNYNNFWKDILEVNGQINLEQLKKELYDYACMIREVSIVYDTLTMGRISKPNTKAQVVIDEVNEVNREIEDDDSKISA